MIYEALLAPHERPPTLREVKRALLTYDKILLIDPGDRDIIPANTFMAVLMGVPMGADMGPIRPMAKVTGYDDDFSKTIDACREAQQQGLLDVKSTYVTQPRLTIGAVLTGGYPLNSRFVFWLYRSMASDQEFLRSAVAERKDPMLSNVDALSQFAAKGLGDGAINDVPALPVLDTGTENDPLALPLTQLARSRLGAFIKYVGYCEAKNLVPVLPSAVYGDIAVRLANNVRILVASIDEDRFWTNRNRVLDLCHEEFLVDSALDDMSVAHVLRLRTAAWGRQAEAREKLFEAVFELATDFGDTPDFEDRARAQICEYRRSTCELLGERQDLRLRIKCDLAIGVLGTGVGLAGLLSQLELPVGTISLALAAGGMWALQRAKEHVPAFRKLQAREREIRRGAAFAFHDFYSRIAPARG